MTREALFAADPKAALAAMHRAQAQGGIPDGTDGLPARRAAHPDQAIDPFETPALGATSIGRLRAAPAAHSMDHAPKGARAATRTVGARPVVHDRSVIGHAPKADSARMVTVRDQRVPEPGRTAIGRAPKAGGPTRTGLVPKAGGLTAIGRAPKVGGPMAIGHAPKEDGLTAIGRAPREDGRTAIGRAPKADGLTVIDRVPKADGLTVIGRAPTVVASGGRDRALVPVRERTGMRAVVAMPRPTRAMQRRAAGLRAGTKVNGIGVPGRERVRSDRRRPRPVRRSRRERALGCAPLGCVPAKASTG